VQIKVLAALEAVATLEQQQKLQVHHCWLSLAVLVVQVRQMLAVVQAEPQAVLVE
jgi:hypothetical protein